MVDGAQPQRLKAVDENKPVIAALKRSTPSRQNRACWGTPALRHPKSGATSSLSASCEAAPYPKPIRENDLRSNPQASPFS
jgi:hypothetical protein